MSETNYFDKAMFAAEEAAAEAQSPLGPDGDVDELAMIASGVRELIKAYQVTYDRRNGSDSFAAARQDPDVTSAMRQLWEHRSSLGIRDANYVQRYLSSLGLVPHPITG